MDDKVAATSHDDQRFVQDLLAIQEFTNNLAETLPQESDVTEGEYFLLDFTNEYLAALQVKQRQLHGIQLHVHKQLAIAKGDLRSKFEFLSELVDDVVPLVKNTVEKLISLQHVITGSRPSDTTDEETSGTGAELSSTSHPVAVNQLAHGQQNAEIPHLSRDMLALTVSGPTDVSEDCARHDDIRPIRSTGFSPDQNYVRDASPNIVRAEFNTRSSAPTMATPIDRIPHIANVTLSVPVGEIVQPSVLPDSGESDFTSDSSSEPEDIIAIKPAEPKHSIDTWQSRNELRDRTTVWKVNRTAEDFLEKLWVKYRNVRVLDLRRPLYIEFVNEAGHDMGALTREFFNISFEAITTGKFKNRRLMEGERGHLLPIADSQMDPSVFEFVGLMIAHAVLNGCRGFPGLSPAVIHCLLHEVQLGGLEDSHPPVTIQDISDQGLRVALENLDNAKQLDDAETACVLDWMEKSHCNVVLGPNTRYLVIQRLLIYYVLEMRIRQISAIAEGMHKLDLLAFLSANDSETNLSQVFPSLEDTSATPEMLLRLIRCRGDYVHHTMEFFKQYVNELHDGRISGGTLSLGDLVRFFTGSQYVPFQVVISFNEDQRLPTAHACFNELELPTVHQDYTAFSNAMTTALTHGVEGFGLA